MNLRRVLPAVLLCAAAAPAAAKVTFTGYGDLRYTNANAVLTGSPASLQVFGLSPGQRPTRGFSADAIGLFATTELRPDLDFQMDVTFKQIGNTVNQLSLQYAYLNWTPAPEVNARAGRVTLPFGYFNENRFYPFQRYTLTAPVFQSGILGLPIADWGVAGKYRHPWSWFGFEASAYAVNGYGNAQGQKQQLRFSTLPGGLALSTNLRSSDNNHKPALGGRVRLTDLGGTKSELGASYYWGDWDASGLEPMYMVDVHAHANVEGFDLLAEALHIGVRGDQGFAPTIGSPNWSTNGGFVTLSYDRLKVKEKTLAPYVQGELYRSRPNNGDPERETLRSVSVGAALRVDEHVMLKAEYLRFHYELPSSPTVGGLGLILEGGLLSAVVTF